MMSHLNLLPGAEPFFFRGSAERGHIGCLVLHGFTGVPGDVHSLGTHLAAQGYTVYGPRLTHHGTDPADLNRSEWHDWYLAGLDGWHVLHAQCQEIVVIGLSMGGSTALLLAARQPVKAVVSMAAPLYLYPDWKLRFTRYIWRVYPFSAKPARSSQQEAEEQFERESYNVNPVRGVAELLEYLEVVEAHLRDVKAPTLLVHSRQDQTVPPGNMDYIYERLASVEKERLWLEQNSHVITESAEKALLFARVADFVAAHTTPVVAAASSAPDGQARRRSPWEYLWQRLRPTPEPASADIKSVAQ
ncbi:MAG: alpha/beta fold hydrolase [Candidatus Promineifilaceae bacterium]